MSYFLDFPLLIMATFGMMLSNTLAICGLFTGLFVPNRDRALIIAGSVGLIYGIIWYYLAWRDDALLRTSYLVFSACPMACMLWALIGRVIRIVWKKIAGTDKPQT